MPQSRGLCRIVVAACLFALFSGFSILAQSTQAFESVLIQSPKPYTTLVSNIQALGGKVKHQYKYVDGVAADIPSNAMEAFRVLVGSSTIEKDLIIPAPVTTSTVRGNSKSGSAITSAPTNNATLIPISELSGVSEAAYSLNNLGLNVRALHLQKPNLTGEGVVVAVVDSGVRPYYPVLALDDAVIGGIDFVGDPQGDPNPLVFSNSQNEPHGTFVAGLITGNVKFGVDSKSKLASSLDVHFPGALDESGLPMVGTAPASRIYAVRVFGVDPTAGAPESRIIAAIDHIIDVRRTFNIQVCNLSLGNTTLYAGRDLFDRSVDALLANDIVPVVAAGDVGPSGLTVSSPATSFSAIAVGSASAAANERVQQDMDNYLGFGLRFRPSGATQVGWFSSRGPNADGRISPDVIANGLGVFGQGYDSVTDLNISSGTSFSAPLVAGVAALLRQAFPKASATQIRNAIAESGAPLDGFTRLDQGYGFADVAKAKKALEGNVSRSLPRAPKPGPSVEDNVELGTESLGTEALKVLSGPVTQSTPLLAPGQREEILYSIPTNTSRVVISLSDFMPTFNVKPNPNRYPEEIYLKVHSAKTSQIGAFGDYYDLGSPFTTGGTFTVNSPEPGIMRITISGSWTNEDTVSAKVKLDTWPLTGDLSDVTTQGTIRHHQTVVFPITIPKGVRLADFRLSFNNDWGHYPTSDVDMILVDPNLNENKDGAHLNAPERATIFRPSAGTWMVKIIGFDIPSGSDKFELRVTLDGELVK
ncbi:MAG: S8 family serine peptidase [Acidobacteria bacterium]|nr:S8 family serine peptidase [Acidobacteriota bacterium]